MLICKNCESKHWMDHKLVIPIISERSVQYKTASVEASRQASPPCLRVRKTNSRPGIRVGRVQGSRETMPIANNIGYGVLSRFHVPLEQPSELEVMLMSTVSAVPLGDESFEQGRQRGVKKNASSHDYFKPQSDLQERHQGQIGPDLKCRPPWAPRMLSSEHTPANALKWTPSSECSQADTFQRMLSSEHTPANALKRTLSSGCSQARALQRMFSSGRLPANALLGVLKRTHSSDCSQADALK